MYDASKACGCRSAPCLLFFLHTLQSNPINFTAFTALLVISLWRTNITLFFFSEECLQLFWCKSYGSKRKQDRCACLCVTCSIVTTCLSPVFVQIGAIPSFAATNPTRRLPGKRSRWKDGFSARQQQDSVYTAVSECYTDPLSIGAAARARLWVGSACQPSVFCIPLQRSSSCTPGCPLWGVPQTMLWSLLSWYKTQSGEDWDRKDKSSCQVICKQYDRLYPDTHTRLSPINLRAPHRIIKCLYLTYFRAVTNNHFSLSTTVLIRFITQTVNLRNIPRWWCLIPLIMLNRFYLQWH